LALACLIAVAADSASAAAPSACAAEPGRIVKCVKPSDTDPAIQHFNAPHYVVYSSVAKPSANLLVYLPGTGGAPPGPVRFLNEAVGAGYRVISLAYNDTPTVVELCRRDPIHACYERLRGMRIFGDETLSNRPGGNSTAESIVNRLTKLLQYLDRADTKAKWGAYLENGEPSWGRIAWAGWSQGAGMAAFVAKEHQVARAVLFSGPFDTFKPPAGSGPQPAAWISKPSETPPERWFGGYHMRENFSDILAQSYAGLGIPQDHIRVFQLDRAMKQSGANDNPFHAEGIYNPAYAPQRAFLLGRSP
jgi:hypothetical protein